MNYAEYILEHNNYDPGKTVSIYKGEKYTLEDYRRETEHLTGLFAKMHFQKNTSAILIFDDNPTTIALYLACIKYGIVPVLISPFTLDSLLEQGLEAARATYLFTTVSGARPPFYDRAVCVAAEPMGKNSHAALTLLNKDYKSAPAYINADKAGYFLMTSGSSGAPKIVIHGHDAFPDTNLNYGVGTLGICQDDIIYSVSKMCFGYGLANSLFFSLLNGAPACLEEAQFTPESMFEKLPVLKPTVFFGVPSVYRMILEYMEGRPELASAFDSVRIFISSGEALDQRTARDWKAAAGKYLSNNMGSSEASAVLFDRGSEASIGCAGLPVKGTRVRLEGPDGKDSDTGVMYFTSKGNFQGYLNLPELYEQVVKDGWFRTGDVFHRDEKGCYWGMGREDNMLKYHAMWVSPVEIQKKIEEFPGVKQAAVYKLVSGREDVLAASAAVTRDFPGVESLRDFLANSIELFKVPGAIDVMEEFPLNGNGKVDLPYLKSRLQEKLDK